MTAYRNNTEMNEIFDSTERCIRKVYMLCVEYGTLHMDSLMQPDKYLRAVWKISEQMVPDVDRKHYELVASSHK